MSKVHSMLALFDRLSVVHDDSERMDLLNKAEACARPFVISFVNQHAINMAWVDPMFRQHLLTADVLLRDGLGASVAMRALGYKPGLNMNGTDFIPKILQRFEGRRVAVFGSRDPWLTSSKRALESWRLSVDLTVDGFRDEGEYAKLTDRAQPRLVLLGMGMPKQERVAALIAQSSDSPVLIVNGGAFVDFVAGRFPRAPRWIQRLRMEWLYRMMLEPRRLWRRYTLGGVLFAWRVGQLWSGRRQKLVG